MGAESRHRLVDALRRVVVFAFTTEAVGAVLLALLFSSRGEAIRSAIYRGIFTSVSAFCNAGFALQTDSLVGYQHSPLVLHVVAALIVLGGLSPVAAMSIPRLLRRRRLQPAVKIVLVVTLLLLVGGALGYAIFEWHDSLAGLGILDHLHNAWFQSVTLRTAGFNSVDTALTRPETRLLMMCLMFIGGSPGGTAGGIKTTTFAVLVLAVWTAISGRNRVLVGGREIRHPTLVRAVAALGSGVLMWLLTVVFLLLTQRIPAEHLVFEATSALGTVGLSTGATPFLDATGKSIIIAAMFLGRVGPLTLFTLLGETRRQRTVDYPEATIPIA
jgi:trk system potassium uptake protein TrkH